MRLSCEKDRQQSPNHRLTIDVAPRKTTLFPVASVNPCRRGIPSRDQPTLRNLGDCYRTVGSSDACATRQGGSSQLTDRLRFRDCLWPAAAMPPKATIMIGTLLALLVLSHVFSQMTKPWNGADHRGGCCKNPCDASPKGDFHGIAFNYRCALSALRRRRILWSPSRLLVRQPIVFGMKALAG